MGVVEEVGELSEALLITQIDDYIVSPHKLGQFFQSEAEEKLHIAEEVGDVMTYLFHICNLIGIEPKLKHLDRWLKEEVSEDGETASE
jgi:NTP pyrophosphatase (non-canonical NTP hydrolase)